MLLIILLYEWVVKYVAVVGDKRLILCENKQRCGQVDTFCRVRRG